MSATHGPLPDRLTAFATRLGDALSHRLSSAVRLALVASEEIHHERAAEDGAPVVHARWRTRGEPAESIHLVLPSADAVTLASLQLGREKEQIAEKRASGLDAESIEALGELVGLATTELTRAFAEGEGAGLVREDEAAEIGAPLAEGAWLEPGRYLRARFALSLDGFPDGRVDVLLPLPVAERWNGGALDPGAAAGPLAIVDADPDTPAQAEELARRLGRDVVHVDPAALARRDAEALEQIASASAIVVAWELAGRAGLELVESLQRDAQARGAALAMASEAPTRAMVGAALRAGAASFVLKPYDAEELARRLFTRRASPDA